MDKIWPLTDSSLARLGPAANAAISEGELEASMEPGPDTPAPNPCKLPRYARQEAQCAAKMLARGRRE